MGLPLELHFSLDIVPLSVTGILIIDTRSYDNEMKARSEPDDIGRARTLSLIEIS